jgi:SWI/SNF-related matrix-associated actin-dependent regulator 1 of chromatin subfamily A
LVPFFPYVDKYYKLSYICNKSSLLEGNHIIESKAISILESYDGPNNYIQDLKRKLMLNKKFYPTRSQSEYIINFYEILPKVAKKWVKLDSYFAQKLADDKMYTKIPDQVWIEKLLAEKEKAYHVWGKVFETEQLHDFWLPKASIIKDNTVKNVVIDFEKYSHRPLLSHQIEAVQKLVENKKYILADDMGLGKTTSTIVAAIETGAKKILIICPASLKINWQREIENYTDRSIYISEGKNFSQEHDFVIINYDIIKNFHNVKKKSDSQILGANFDLVVVDEAHYIKNGQAQRTKLINDLVKNVDRLWLLTGTPMTSRPMDYFNLLSLVDSPVAKNWMAYAIRYCSGYQFNAGGRKIWNVTGASNLEELRDRTSGLTLRRLKQDVLDLPDKIITPVYLRLKSKQYEEVMGDYYNWYEKNPDESKSLTVQFTKLTQVRQVIADEKTQQTIELAENIIEQGKKVIIFCNFTNSLDKIVQHFGKTAVRLDGSMSKPDRQNSVDRFQTDDKVNVFVGNIKAAGVGITLTAGEAVIMNDLSFLPSDHSQAEDRAYRYGQKNNVLVYYPIFENTIEGIIYDILNNKKQVIATVMGDNQNSGDVAEEILKRINEMRR